MKERIEWIDMAKGYGILLVIYAHLGRDSLWTWMYSFHLPLFFFLSGYVFNGQRKFGEFVQKKCKAILVPYFCLGIPMVMFQILLLINAGKFSLKECLWLVKSLLLQERFWTLWFIACLFCLNLLLYALFRVCKKEWMVSAVSVIMPIMGLCYYKYGGRPLPWNVDVCAMAIPFFYVGYACKKYGQMIEERLKEKSVWAVSFVICASINIVCWKLSLDETGLGLEIFQSNYGNPVFTYIAAFAGIFCLILWSKTFIIPPIKYIGENSMLYYVWHQTIFIPIAQKILDEIGIIPFKWLSLIIIVGLISVCNWMIKKMKLTWMVGK